jgi:hypothetical protein
MRHLITAALGALAIAAAGPAFAASGPGTAHQGAPVAVGSDLAKSGAGAGKTSQGGGGVPIVAKPHCPAGSISCGKDCRPAGSTCPKV